MNYWQLSRGSLTCRVKSSWCEALCVEGCHKFVTRLHMREHCGNLAVVKTSFKTNKTKKIKKSRPQLIWNAWWVTSCRHVEENDHVRFTLLQPQTSVRWGNNDVMEQIISTDWSQSRSSATRAPKLSQLLQTSQLQTICAAHLMWTSVRHTKCEYTITILANCWEKNDNRKEKSTLRGLHRLPGLLISSWQTPELLIYHKSQLPRNTVHEVRTGKNSVNMRYRCLVNPSCEHIWPVFKYSSWVTQSKCWVRAHTSALLNIYFFPLSCRLFQQLIIRIKFPKSTKAKSCQVVLKIDFRAELLSVLFIPSYKRSAPSSWCSVSLCNLFTNNQLVLFTTTIRLSWMISNLTQRLSDKVHLDQVDEAWIVE